MRSKIIISTALIAVLMSLYSLSGLLLPKEIAQSIQPTQAPENSYKVWFAKRDLPVGGKLLRADLQIKIIAEKEAFSLGISHDVTFDIIKDAVWNNHIAKGAVVTQDLLTRPDEDGYIELVIAENRVPFVIEVNQSSIIGGFISYGSVVDVLALSSTKQILANEERVSSYKGLSVSPILMGARVLKIDVQSIENARQNMTSNKVTLVLELTRKQVAILTIAKRIAELEIHKSVGKYLGNELEANSGDVLADFKAITEYRADTVIIK
ncbi:MAG: Flp pilus assembly protein CpaB [Aliivibrio sp.]|uniref:Flp pilus assembly protein CpaB n=1 Tax=Aliivibrio sp. TaxID=1872443 RepID=UPI001A3BD617|nr:Flp pilus assembly protein CpaB [Aliivibrio sp.]